MMKLFINTNLYAFQTPSLVRKMSKLVLALVAISIVSAVQGKVVFQVSRVLLFR